MVEPTVVDSLGPEPDTILNAESAPSDATRCIIAGSRSATDKLSAHGLQLLIDDAVRKLPCEIDEVVSGAARGVDTAGEQWATDNDIPVAQFPVHDSDWERHGKAAGPIRNEKMAKYAKFGDRGVLLAIIDYPSNGTESMIRLAREFLGDDNVFVVPIGDIEDDAARARLEPVLLEQLD